MGRSTDTGRENEKLEQRETLIEKEKINREQVKKRNNHK